MGDEGIIARNRLSLPGEIRVRTGYGRYLRPSFRRLPEVRSSRWHGVGRSIANVPHFREERQVSTYGMGASTKVFTFCLIRGLISAIGNNLEQSNLYVHRSRSFLERVQKTVFVLGRVGERSFTTTREAHGTGKKRVEQGNERRPISGMHET